MMVNKNFESVTHKIEFLLKKVVPDMFFLVGLQGVVDILDMARPLLY